jgi:hypothetical protein
VCVWGGVLAIIKCIYLLPTYLHFMQDIEDRCLLLTSSTSFVDLPFQEHRMTEKHHMDKNPYISTSPPPSSGRSPAASTPKIAWRECKSLDGKSNNSFSKGSGGPMHVQTSESTNSQTLGVWRSEVDPTEESSLEEDDEDHIEEIFGQLWAIPRPAKPRAPPPANGGYLAWVRHELVEAN